MKNARIAGALLTLTVFSPLLFGCGGGSGTVNTVSNNTGRGVLTMQINFPSGKAAQKVSGTAGKSGPTRVTGFSNGNIPAGTHAVKVEVVTTTSPETSLGLPQIITPSATSTNGVTGPVTVNFTNLPVGNVRVRATAYPDIPAQMTPIAIGTSDVAITSNATTTANVSLALTIDHIAVSPTTLTLGFLSTDFQATITAIPMDKNNNPLLMSLLITTNRPDVVSVNATTPPANTPATTSVFAAQTVSPTAATLPTTANITIAEPNSGQTATISTNVLNDNPPF